MLKEGPGGIQEAGTGTEGTAGRASVKSQALDTSNLGKVENKVIYLKQDTEDICFAQSRFMNSMNTNKVSLTRI